MYMVIYVDVRTLKVDFLLNPFNTYQEALDAVNILKKDCEYKKFKIVPKIHFKSTYNDLKKYIEEQQAEMDADMFNVMTEVE